MRKFFQNLNWQNANLVQKQVVIFIGLTVFILLFGAISLGNIGTIQRNQQEVLANVSDFLNLSQTLQSDVDDLNQIVTDIYQVVDSNSYQNFSQVTIVLPTQAEAAFESIRENIDNLRESSYSVISTDPVENPLLVELDILESDLDVFEQQYNTYLNNALNLAEPATGLLNESRRLGDELEAITVSQAALQEQVAQVLFIRGLESNILTGGGEEQFPAFSEAMSTFSDLHGRNPFPLNHPSDVTVLSVQYILSVENTASAVRRFNSSYELINLAGPILLDDASRINTISRSVTSTTGEFLEERGAQARNNGLFAFIGTLLTVFLFEFFNTRATIRKIRNLEDQVDLINRGDYDSRIDIAGNDELGRMGDGLNEISTQFIELTQNLEERIAQSTRDLSFSSAFGRLAFQTSSPQELMNVLVENIRERFDFYHAQVFLLDEEGTNADLVASTGTVGRQLLARRHSLPVGSRSVIGQTTANNEPMIALDTGTDAVFRRNQLLPRTRSEMALPLVTGGQVIGALDVQSVVPNAFNEDDVAVFQIIADQLAMLVENSRLRAALSQSNERYDALERRILTEGWRSYIREKDEAGQTSFAIDDEGIRPHEVEDLPDAMKTAIARGELIILDEEEDDFSLGIPIMVQNEVIGVFGFEGENIKNLSSEDLTLIQSITERIGLALETIRLSDEAAQRALQEEMISEISSKISQSTNVEYILQTATQEIGRILRAPQTSIQLKPEVEVDND